MNVRTSKAGSKRTKDVQGIRGVELTGHPLHVITSHCMTCGVVYRVRVNETDAPREPVKSHGYCDLHTLNTAGI